VTPLGEPIAHQARGLVYGNRGCLHDAAGEIRRFHDGRRWIACRLTFRDWNRGPLMQPGRFTEPFFLDEATALAAGHRPCALCRRADHQRLHAVWQGVYPGACTADAIDARLHAERLDPSGRRRLHGVQAALLPDGAFWMWRGRPHLVLGERLLRWTPSGYDGAERRPAAGHVDAVTPPSLMAVLAAGWSPLVEHLHQSAARWARLGVRSQRPAEQPSGGHGE